MVRAGESRSSAFTGAGGIFWQIVFGIGVVSFSTEAPLSCTDWDRFHREDIACSRARARTLLVQE
eukprot:5763773-Lingulodinium_polyedra.AAC.1